MPQSIEGFLRQALSRGLITATQQASLLSLAAEEGPAPREMPRGFNWVTIAYALGALLVVFADGWSAPLPTPPTGGCLVRQDQVVVTWHFPFGSPGW